MVLFIIRTQVTCAKDMNKFITKYQLRIKIHNIFFFFIRLVNRMAFILLKKNIYIIVFVTKYLLAYIRICSKNIPIIQGGN